MKRLEDMNLMDDFLFWSVLSDENYGPQIASYILEVIFQRPVGKVTVHTQKVFYGRDPDLHGIRMDAYIEEDDETGSVKGDVYNLEAERKRSQKKELPLRARYYHSMNDTKLLGSGNEYSDLPRFYVIIITSYDPFDRNRILYTVKNTCLEEPDLPYDDRAYTLFLYTEGTQEGLSKELIDLLHYMEHSTKEMACNGRLAQIHNIVKDVKQRREVQEEYMDLHYYIKTEVEAGIEEGLEEVREEAHKKGIEEGRAEGRAEERLNTLREKERADQAEKEKDQALARIAELEKLLAK